MIISMRRLLCFFTLLGLLASCYPLVDPDKQQEARRGLDAALAQLPTLQRFTTAKILVYESHDAEHSSEYVCYYAKGYIVAGSSLPAEDAVSYYAQSVQPLGWSPNSDKLASERLLDRGLYERIVISPYEPEIEIQNAVGYAQLKKTYLSVIVIRVDYTLPSRDRC